MRTLLRRALFDPAGLVAAGECTRRRTAGVLAVAALVGLAPAPAKILAFRSDAVDWGALGSYPPFTYAAGVDAVSVPGLYALLVLSAIVLPLLASVAFGAVLHTLSHPFAGTGSYRQTVVVTVWGLVPQAIASAAAMGVVYAGFAVGGPPPVVTGINVPARVVVYPLELASPWLLLDLLVTASLLWTGYVWAYGLAAVRSVTPRQAAAVVALPLVWTLLGTVAGQWVLSTVLGVL